MADLIESSSSSSDPVAVVLSWHGAMTSTHHRNRLSFCKVDQTSSCTTSDELSVSARDPNDVFDEEHVVEDGAEGLVGRDRFPVSGLAAVPEELNAVQVWSVRSVEDQLDIDLRSLSCIKNESRFVNPCIVEEHSNLCLRTQLQSESFQLFDCCCSIESSICECQPTFTSNITDVTLTSNRGASLLSIPVTSDKRLTNWSPALITALL